jgi:alanyl-tRNA synthetase
MTTTPEFKIIADHLRSASFLIADGVMPSNEGRGYVLRRIMRRAMRQLHKLGAKNAVMHKLVDVLIKEMGDAYPELARARDAIIDVLKNEEEKFRETLEKGLKILEEEIAKKSAGRFSGVVAFKLYDTYGFPLDLTQDILKESCIEVDIEKFNSEMELQRDRARKNWAGSGEELQEKLFFDLKEKYGETKFLGYKDDFSDAKILAIIKDGAEVENIKIGDKNILLILDKTTFYATSGGQKGDDGVIIKNNDNNINQQELINFIQNKHNITNIVNIPHLIQNTEFMTKDFCQKSQRGMKAVVDATASFPNGIFGEKMKSEIGILHQMGYIHETKKFAGNLFAHIVSDVYGEFKVGDQVLTFINKESRQYRANNHSATHLLHKALKEILGNSISQKGSNVETKYFTFDFNFARPLAAEEFAKVEDLVNSNIRKNLSVKTEVIDLASARKKGAESLFGEKYDNEVRVVEMGSSLELCGGTHVNATGDIGVFKIISEKSIASGIRRIEAVTGFYAMEYFKNTAKKSENLINEFEQKMRQKDREISSLKKQVLLANLADLRAETIGEINLVHHIFENVSAKDLREIAIEIKSKKTFQNSHIFILFAINDDKVSACVALSENLTQKFNAMELIAPIIKEIGGSGSGGKKDIAIGGGVNKHKVQSAINNTIFNLGIIKQMGC